MAIWELAPGSPWDANFSLLVMSSFWGPCISRSGFGQHLAGGFEVGRGIDAPRDRVHDHDVDPHAGFQRSELLEFLLLLERRGRQRHKALQRGAAIGVKADMMVAW